MILIFCIFSILFCIITKYLIFRKHAEVSYKSFDEIPCPDAVPVLGNISDMFCSGAEIWKITRNRALKYYPIYRLKILNTNIVYLHHPEDIQQILGSSKHIKKSSLYETFSKLTGHGLLVSNEESWRNRRKLLTKSFHFTTLQNYMKVFNRGAINLVNQLQKQINKSSDILEAVSCSTLKIINEIIVGKDLRLPDSEVKRYESALDTISQIIGYKGSKPVFNVLYNRSQLKKEEDIALKILHSFSTNVIKNYAKNKRTEDDNSRVLDVMIKAPGLYDEQGIKDEICTFLFAGNSTTAAGLLYALLILANYPKYQDGIYQEIIQVVGLEESPSYADLTSMSFLDRFLKECLRLYPPAPFMGRIINEDIITKTGYRIPAGTSLMFQIFDIHRSPYIFENPEVFDPDRFLPDNVKIRHPFSYIPFSAGPRNCIAQKFAVLEMKASICEILKRFKLEPVTMIEDIMFVPDVSLKTTESVKVKLVSRS